MANSGRRPKYRDTIAYIPGGGEKKRKKKKEFLYNDEIWGERGSHRSRWAAGPLLLSRAHFLEKFFEGSWNGDDEKIFP